MRLRCPATFALHRDCSTIVEMNQAKLAPLGGSVKTPSPGQPQRYHEHAARSDVFVESDEGVFMTLAGTTSVAHVVHSGCSPATVSSCHQADGRFGVASVRRKMPHLVCKHIMDAIMFQMCKHNSIISRREAPVKQVNELYWHGAAAGRTANAKKAKRRSTLDVGHRKKRKRTK